MEALLKLEQTLAPPPFLPDSPQLLGHYQSLHPLPGCHLQMEKDRGVSTERRSAPARLTREANRACRSAARGSSEQCKQTAYKKKTPRNNGCLDLHQKVTGEQEQLLLSNDHCSPCPIHLHF